MTPIAVMSDGTYLVRMTIDEIAVAAGYERKEHMPTFSVWAYSRPNVLLPLDEAIPHRSAAVDPAAALGRVK